MDVTPETEVIAENITVCAPWHILTKTSPNNQSNVTQPPKDALNLGNSIIVPSSPRSVASDGRLKNSPRVRQPAVPSIESQSPELRGASHLVPAAA